MMAKVGVESGGDVISRGWRGPRVPKAVLLSGIAAAGVYGAGDLVSGLLYDGYSFRDQAISELTAFGSPVRPLMVTVILVHNLLLIGFGVGVWQVADRRSLRWAGLTLAMVGVSGAPTHTIYAMSSRWMETGLDDRMHIALSVLFTLLVLVAIVLAAIAYRGWFRLHSIATLAVLMGFGAAASFAIRGIEQDSTQWAGGFERINAYAYLAWLVVLTATVTRRAVAAAGADP